MEASASGMLGTVLTAMFYVLKVNDKSLTTGEDILHPSQSQIGGWVERIPLVSSNFIDFPACRIDLFQS